MFKSTTSKIRTATKKTAQQIADDVQAKAMLRRSRLEDEAETVMLEMMEAAGQWANVERVIHGVTVLYKHSVFSVLVYKRGGRRGYWAQVDDSDLPGVISGRLQVKYRSRTNYFSVA